MAQRRLPQRSGPFRSAVGRLQPILAELPRTNSSTVLRGGGVTKDVREQVTSQVTSQVDALQADRTGLDLDFLPDDVLDMPSRPAATLDLAALDGVSRRPEVMPPAIAVRSLGAREYGYLAPGTGGELRVTTHPRLFEEQAESLELWSPGSPLFPDPCDVAGADTSDLDDQAGAMSSSFSELLSLKISSLT